LEVDPNFLGPAALAKAYRFVADPRDGQEKSRLDSLRKYSGIWDCTRCAECVEACPKGVDPMQRIMVLRDRAMRIGFDKEIGARHTDAFVELVGHSGRLDELRLPIKTVGMFNLPAMKSLTPVGLRALIRGKMPPIFHKMLPNVENVRRIFRRLEPEE
jgi:succinate dehydrogenase / fumarate reductase iron-sulfur subunit